MSQNKLQPIPRPPKDPPGNNRYKRQITFEDEVPKILEDSIQMNQSYDAKLSQKHKKPSYSSFTPYQSRPISEIGSIKIKSRPDSTVRKNVGLNDKSFSLNTSYNCSTNINTSVNQSHEIFLMNKMRYKKKLEEKTVSLSSDYENFKPKISEKESVYRRNRRLGLGNMYRRDKLPDDKIFMIEKLGRHKPQIFKERHISEVALKIKKLMNHSDNVDANEIQKRLKNKDLASKLIAKLGIANKDYVKEFPPFVNLYSKHIENTVLGLTRELKREMVDRDIVKMLIQKNEEKKIEKRPLLYSFDFNLETFLRERQMRSITTYLRYHEEEIWTALSSRPEELLDYVACGGDYRVGEIFKRMESPEGKRIPTDSSMYSGTFLTTDESRDSRTQDSPIGRKLSHLEGLLNPEYVKKSKYLFNNTKRFLDKMKSMIEERDEFDVKNSKSTLG